jgi:hypothetical protein
MRYDQLVCAACAGRVIDGQCAVCRQMRSELRQRSPFGTLDWHDLLLPFLAALAALVCLVAYYVRMA